VSYLCHQCYQWLKSGNPLVLEQWYNLTLKPGPRSALILDVSESAKPFWPVLRSLTEGVLESLPADAWPEIFFLGNPQPFPAEEFGAKAESWHAANAGRGSFAGPIFEELAGAPNRAVAVVGSGNIFDLPDWSEENIAQHAIWCRYGPAALTDGAFLEEPYTVEQLTEKLNNPAVCVEVSGPGVMPFFWDDPTFRWQRGMLAGTKTSGSLLVGILSPEPDRARARVVLANGSEQMLPLEPVEAPAPPEWRQLPSREDTLLRQALRQGRYTCPACQQAHPAGQWRCTNPAAAPTFPSLTNAAGGFAVLDASAWQTRIRLHPCAALQLKPDAVAMHSGDGGAEIIRFDGQSWRAGSERLGPIHPLEERRYVLVL
jgi:hypothetical protein